jgi:succinyl-diaminopimelate desuccinylase
VKADLVIAGEYTPTGAICHESKGVCWARVHFTGLRAHSAYPWNGQNALVQAVRYCEALLQALPVLKQEAWQTTANIARIETPNTTFNQVPDQATVDIDIRHITNDPRFISKAAAQAFLQGFDLAATVAILGFESHHYADPAHPLVARLAQAVREATGKPATFIRKHGGSDVRFYTARKQAAVVMGLDGKGLHEDEEYTTSASIEQYSRVLAAFLAKVPVDKKL